MEARTEAMEERNGMEFMLERTNELCYLQGKPPPVYWCTVDFCAVT